MRKIIYHIVSSLMAFVGFGTGMAVEAGMAYDAAKAFYWGTPGFSDTQWTNLESQADELSEFFKLIWIPQSQGNCGSSNSMGYNDLY